MTPVSAIALEDSLKARSRAAAAKSTRTTKVAKGVKRITPLSQKAAAQKAAGHDKPRSNAAPKKATAAKKPTAKKPGSGPHARLNTAWPDSKGNDLQMGDEVKGPGGLAGIVKSRFSGKDRIPFVALTVTGGEGYAAAAADGKPPRGKHIAAAELTRTKAKK